MTGLEREGPARRSFRAKLELLEAAAAGRQTLSWIPRTVKEVRDWSEPDRGLTSWSSFTVATLNGPNGDLRRRLDAALALLNRKERSRSDQHRSRTDEHRLALREVAALAAQNVAFSVQIADLKAEVARRQDLIEILSARERDLIDTLNKILPAHQRLRSVSPRL